MDHNEGATKKTINGVEIVGRNNPLIESIKNITEPHRTGRQPWHVRMKKKHPEQFENLLEVVQDFQAGGEALHRLRSVSELYRWLCEQDAFPEPIGDCQFRVWFREVASNG